jgi:hypothetical protein
VSIISLNMPTWPLKAGSNRSSNEVMSRPVNLGL